MTTVAILGTGKMGGAMARRLASAGFDIMLWNRSATRAEELHLGRVAASPAEAVRGADIVISSLTNDAAVRDVYLGEQRCAERRRRRSGRRHQHGRPRHRRGDWPGCAGEGHSVSRRPGRRQRAGDRERQAAHPCGR